MNASLTDFNDQCLVLCVFFFFPTASSPTSAAQINLAGLRNNSLTNQDTPFDPSSDNRLRNSCMSLDEKTRTMSRSGSFRDGFEEGKEEKHRFQLNSVVLGTWVKIRCKCKQGTFPRYCRTLQSAPPLRGVCQRNYSSILLSNISADYSPALEINIFIPFGNS